MLIQEARLQDLITETRVETVIMLYEKGVIRNSLQGESRDVISFLLTMVGLDYKEVTYWLDYFDVKNN